jgi:hypothetical protein
VRHDQHLVFFEQAVQGIRHPGAEGFPAFSQGGVLSYGGSSDGAIFQ